MSHKYGVKIFKVCDPLGYTFRTSLYSGKSSKGEGPLAERVVLQLCDRYLGAGRTIVVDNFYTSVPIANKLLENDTHLLDTLRKNRRGLPEEVVKAKLKKGDIIGKMNGDGIVVAIWKDKREVHFLSTKHGVDVVNIGRKNRHGEEVKKPRAIIDYNKGKGVDLYDQIASYFSPLRKTIRWYHKVVFEVLLNIAVINPWVIYNVLKKDKISITSFRE